MKDTDSRQNSPNNNDGLLTKDNSHKALIHKNEESLVEGDCLKMSRGVISRQDLLSEYLNKSSCEQTHKRSDKVFRSEQEKEAGMSDGNEEKCRVEQAIIKDRESGRPCEDMQSMEESNAVNGKLSCGYLQTVNEDKVQKAVAKECPEKIGVKEKTKVENKTEVISKLDERLNQERVNNTFIQEKVYNTFIQENVINLELSSSEKTFENAKNSSEVCENDSNNSFGENKSHPSLISMNVITPLENINNQVFGQKLTSENDFISVKTHKDKHAGEKFSEYNSFGSDFRQECSRPEIQAISVERKESSTTQHPLSHVKDGQRNIHANNQTSKLNCSGYRPINGYAMEERKSNYELVTNQIRQNETRIRLFKTYLNTLEAISRSTVSPVKIVKRRKKEFNCILREEDVMKDYHAMFGSPHDLRVEEAVSANIKPDKRYKKGYREIGGKNSEAEGDVDAIKYTIVQGKGRKGRKKKLITGDQPPENIENRGVCSASQSDNTQDTGRLQSVQEPGKKKRIHWRHRRKMESMAAETEGPTFSTTGNLQKYNNQGLVNLSTEGVSGTEINSCETNKSDADNIEGARASCVLSATENTSQKDSAFLIENASQEEDTANISHSIKKNSYKEPLTDSLINHKENSGQKSFDDLQFNLQENLDQEPLAHSQISLKENSKELQDSIIAKTCKNVRRFSKGVEKQTKRHKNKNKKSGKSSIKKTNTNSGVVHKNSGQFENEEEGDLQNDNKECDSYEIKNLESYNSIESQIIDENPEINQNQVKNNIVLLEKNEDTQSGQIQGEKNIKLLENTEDTQSGEIQGEKNIKLSEKNEDTQSGQIQGEKNIKLSEKNEYSQSKQILSENCIDLLENKQDPQSKQILSENRTDFLENNQDIQSKQILSKNISYSSINNQDSQSKQISSQNKINSLINNQYLQSKQTQGENNSNSLIKEPSSNSITIDLQHNNNSKIDSLVFLNNSTRKESSKIVNVQENSVLQDSVKKDDDTDSNASIDEMKPTIFNKSFCKVQNIDLDLKYAKKQKYKSEKEINSQNINKNSQTNKNDTISQSNTGNLQISVDIENCVGEVFTTGKAIHNVLPSSEINITGDKKTNPTILGKYLTNNNNEKIASSRRIIKNKAVFSKKNIKKNISGCNGSKEGESGENDLNEHISQVSSPGKPANENDINSLNVKEKETEFCNSNDGIKTSLDRYRSKISCYTPNQTSSNISDFCSSSKNKEIFIPEKHEEFELLTVKENGFNQVAQNDIYNNTEIFNCTSNSAEILQSNSLIKDSNNENITSKISIYQEDFSYNEKTNSLSSKNKNILNNIAGLGLCTNNLLKNDQDVESLLLPPQAKLKLEKERIIGIKKHETPLILRHKQIQFRNKRSDSESDSQVAKMIQSKNNHLIHKPVEENDLCKFKFINSSLFTSIPAFIDKKIYLEQKNQDLMIPKKNKAIILDDKNSEMFKYEQKYDNHVKTTEKKEENKNIFIKSGKNDNFNQSKDRLNNSEVMNSINNNFNTILSKNQTKCSFKISEDKKKQISFQKNNYKIKYKLKDYDNKKYEEQEK